MHARPPRPAAVLFAVAPPVALVALLSLLAICATPPAPDRAGAGPAPGAAPGSAAAPRGALAPAPAPPTVTLAPGAVPGALTVVAARPQGAATGTIRPTVTFSRPVFVLGDAASAALPPGEAPARLVPDAPGEWRWVGSASLEFVPRRGLPLSTEFRVEVPAGLRAVDGAVLAAPYAFTFSTPRPEILSTDPGQGYRWVRPEQVFALVTSQPVRDVVRHVQLRAAGNVVALRLAREVDVAEEERGRAKREPRRFAPEPDRGFADRRTRYELVPSRPLPLGAPVTLTIDAGLPGGDGPLTLGEPRTLEMATYGPLNIERARCAWAGEASPSCPYGPLVLETSNDVESAQLKGRLKLTPPVNLDWEKAESMSTWGGDTSRPALVIPGDFVPGTTYRVDVEAGVTDVYGQPAGPFHGTLPLSNVDPALYIDRTDALIEAAGDGALPIRTVNVDRVPASIWVLSPAEMARAENRWNEKSGWPGRAPDRRVTVKTAARRNAWRWTPLDLRAALPKGSKGGLFFVRVESAATRYPTRYPVLAQVTDLAVHARLGATAGIVWVTRLSTGAVVPGAKVTLYDRDGTSKATATTNADGLAKLPGLTGLVATEPWSGPSRVLVAATLGNEIGVTTTDHQDGTNPWQFGVTGGWDGTQPVVLGVVNAERGIYRPGDEVQLKGIVRYRGAGTLNTPRAGTTGKLVVRDARGQDVATQGLSLSAYGTFAAKVAIPADAPLGGWYAEAALDLPGGRGNIGGSFRVEEYRAPQFRVDVRARRVSVTGGEPLESDVDARYLFGGAMGGAAVRWSITRATTEFTPENNPGFTFGVHTWGWDDDGPRPTTDVVAGGEGVIDAKGAFAVPATMAETPAGRTWTYTTEAEVTDVNRQRTANRTSATVHPAAAYAGVRLPAEGFVTAGREVGLELVAAAPDGNRVDGAALEVAIRHRKWNWIRKRESGGEWYTVAEPVDTVVAACTTTSAATPVPCAFRPAEPGLYLVDATVTDAQKRRQTTKTSLYAIGSGWVSWQQDDSPRIELVPDRGRYAVGDVAKVLVKSPWPKADALVTIEREGVRSVRRVALEGSATALDVPIDDDMVPNVFVSVLMVRGRVANAPAVEGDIDPGRPAVRVGIAELKVEKATRRLAVDVTVDASERRPRETVTVDLTVRDAGGKPARAEVTVWAVDEGVLRLTGYRTPDVVEAIHEQRPLSVRILDSILTLLKKREYKEKGGTPVAQATGLDESYAGVPGGVARAWGGGGGDAAGAGFRSRFRTTVLFQPEVVTGADGRARVSFELPDNLTTFRIMALAVDAGDRFGSGESKVAVNKPLLALPALPRFARVGDSFEAGVVVHGAAGQTRSVDVAAAAQGLAIDGAPSRRVTLTDGKAQEVRFRFVAKTPGSATLRFRVAGDGDSDGIEQQLVVQLPMAMETVAAYGDTNDRRVEGIAPPRGVRQDAGGLTVTLASSALGGFSEVARQLVEYPYGCVEQLASRLVPFVEMRTLQSAFGLAPAAATAEQREEMARSSAWLTRWIGADALTFTGAESPDEVVRQTVAKIVALQGPDGGFRYWPSSPCSMPYASPYAVLALSRAQRAGFDVDAQAIARGRRYLGEVVAAGRTVRCDGTSIPIDEVSRVFALWVLARTGAPLGSYYGELHGARDRLPLFARAMLADAMLAGGATGGATGDARSGQEALNELAGFARETAGEVHFQEVDPARLAEYWSSDTRTTAVALMLLAGRAPDHPYVGKIARWLAAQRQRDGRYRTTQESAFTLMALAELLATKEKDVPDFTARVTLGARELAAVPFRGRSLDVERADVPMSSLAADAGGSPLAFTKDGRGVLYYSASLRYVPPQTDQPALDRGIVVQRWIEPWDAPGRSATSVTAGDLLRLRVRLATPAERRFVAASIPIPAGLEPVDTSLATSARPPRASVPEADLGGEGAEGEALEGSFDEGADDEAGPWAGAFWSPFNHRELRDDRVLLFADQLPPGVHETTVILRATTPGRFTFLPARAEEMYAPEVCGRTDSAVFDVAP